MPIKKRISRLFGLNSTVPPAANVQQKGKPSKEATAGRSRNDARHAQAAGTAPVQKPAVGDLKSLRSMASRNAGVSQPSASDANHLPVVKRTIVKINEDATFERPNTVTNSSLTNTEHNIDFPTDQFSNSHWQQTPLHRHHQQQLCYLDDVPSTNITHEYAGEPELSITTQDPAVTEIVHHSHKHQLQRKITHEKHLFQHETAVQPIFHEVTAEQILHSQQLPELRHQSTKMQASAVHEEDLQRKIQNHIKSVPENKPDSHVYEECAPHVHEIVHRHIIREIHPVIRRDVHVPHLHQDYQHLHEIHYNPIIYKDLEILETLSYDAWQAQTQKSDVRIEMNKPAFTDF